MRKLMFAGLILLMAAGVQAAAPGNAYAFMFRYDGPYKGRVVEAGTGAPIEGAVVLGVWYKEYPNVAGSTSKFYDSKETVTDKNGDFMIPGQGLLIMSNIQVMDVLIFKAGYEYIGLGTWSAFKGDPLLSKIVRWEGNRVIVPIKKFTDIEERKKSGRPSLPYGPYEAKKVPLLIREINKEEIFFNRKPYPEQ